MVKTPVMDCMICEKHKDFAPFAGVAVAKTKNMILSHFPVIDGEPAVRGHLLIEAVRHVVDPAELSDEEAADLGIFIRRGIQLLTGPLRAEHAYVFRINDKVAHFHVHVVPRFPGTPKEFWGHKITEYPGAVKLSLDEVKALSAELKNGATAKK